jgi:hypothetical protein
LHPVFPSYGQQFSWSQSCISDLVTVFLEPCISAVTWSGCFLGLPYSCPGVVRNAPSPLLGWVSCFFVLHIFLFFDLLPHPPVLSWEGSSMVEIFLKCLKLSKIISTQPSHINDIHCIWNSRFEYSAPLTSGFHYHFFKTQWTFVKSLRTWKGLVAFRKIMELAFYPLSWHFLWLVWAIFCPYSYPSLDSFHWDTYIFLVWEISLNYRRVLSSHNSLVHPTCFFWNLLISLYTSVIDSHPLLIPYFSPLLFFIHLFALFLGRFPKL